MTSTPVADSVRLALPTEAEQIAAIQRRSWDQLLPADLRAAALASVTVEDMTTLWHRAIVGPPEARFRVLVAVQDRTVVGFATTTPSDDPDAEPRTDGQIDEFVVDPPAQRRGHGSRLMHACVDTLRADGFVRARHWVSTVDDVRRGFFVDAGWAPDGSHRELGAADDPNGPDDPGSPAGPDDPHAARLRQVRLHTDLSEPA